MADKQEGAAFDADHQGRLDLALRASNEGIWDWWTDRREIYFSRRILEFLECGDRTAPNPFLAPHEMVHQDDRERFASALRSALDVGGPELFAIDCRMRSGGGRWRWMRVRGTVVRDRKGLAVRIAGSMIDISRRKAAEAQIEEERHMLKTLIEHVPLMIYFKDLESRFVVVNQKMANWNGAKLPEEMIGKHDRDIFAAEHWEEAAADEKQVMATEQAIIDKLEREVREAEGESDTYVLTSKFPWFNRHGQIKGTFGVSSDVTELVEAQKATSELAGELAIRNQNYEEEVQLAREIQQALANSQFPAIEQNGSKLRFGARYLPISGLAGDFYEVVKITDRVAGLLICDVMGHGVRSALVVAMLRGLLEKQRRSAARPTTYLSGLNNGLQSILQRAGATMFATAFYAVIDLDAGVMRYACAGHPGAIVIDREGGVRQLCARRDERGPGLGLMARAKFPQGEIPLSKVSRLLSFTDGILEAENEDQEQFLEERLLQEVEGRSGQTLEELLDGILSKVLSFAEGNHFDDDVCLLGVEVARHRS